MSKKAKWIREQACAICSFPPPSECSHVRTAANSGIGIKPPDEYTIPACRNCHALEHKWGRAEVLKRVKGVFINAYEARDWYLDLAAKYERMFNEASQ